MSPNSQYIADMFKLSDVKPLPGDASTRFYFRGNKGDNSFIVMVYPDSSKESRANLKASLDKSEMMSKQGIKVAKCYEVDKQSTCALLEDLGEKSFGDCLRNASDSPKNLYRMATDVLVKMRDIKETQDLPLYKDTHIYANRRQIIDYYMAYKLGQAASDAHITDFHDVWDQIESSLPTCPQGFVHGDYHLENLMFCGSEEGGRQCGVIDNQDAFYGPLPYDLVNLLEDARTDVPTDIRSSMMDLYTRNMSSEEKEIFKAWYAVLAAQFHGRVIGLFIKFAAEQNDDSYLVHIPRLQKYLTASLANPVLEPIKTWFEKVRLDFHTVTPLDGDHVRAALK